jgi:hypothetical protein
LEAQEAQRQSHFPSLDHAQARQSRCAKTAVHRWRQSCHWSAPLLRHQVQLPLPQEDEAETLVRHLQRMAGRRWKKTSPQHRAAAGAEVVAGPSTPRDAAKKARKKKLEQRRHCPVGPMNCHRIPHFRHPWTSRDRQGTLAKPRAPHEGSRATRGSAPPSACRQQRGEARSRASRCRPGQEGQMKGAKQRVGER